MSDFMLRSLFNGYILTTICREIKSTQWSGHIKRYAVSIGQNSQYRSPDFVNSITIGSDSISTNQNTVYKPLAHKQTRCVITRYSHRNVILLKLIGRQACSLHKRTGLISNYRNFLSFSLGETDHA